MNGALKELARVKVSEKRTIAISKDITENKILIGQQIHTEDEHGRPLNFFLKGALNIPVDSLALVRDAIGEALKKL